MQPTTELEPARKVLETSIRVGAVFLLVWWCGAILLPFLMPVLWGAILAVALRPLHLRLTRLLKGHQRWAAALLTLAALALLLTPSVLLSVSLIDGAHQLATAIGEGTLQIPPPPEAVAGWPLIGESLDKIWSQASSNFDAAIAQFSPQLERLGTWLLSAVGGVALQIALFTFAIVIAGILLAKAARGRALMNSVARRLAGDRGKGLVDLTAATIRSVAQGVLGVAIIQSLAAGLGLVLAGVPYSGVWALAVLFLAIIQLPPLLVLLPIVFYVFANNSTTPAVLFAIWAMLVSSSDAFLKPLLLGRGVDIPMLVILLGAIGGLVMSGIIGLFVGAVVLALGYKLFIAWLHFGEASTEKLFVKAGSNK